jgi:Na+-translocating ferredoxin:NAD+ oxidoreductase subunit G
MKEILKLTASLTLICAIAGAALAYFNALTTAPKAKAQIAQRTAKMRLVLPAETAETEEVATAKNGVVFFAAKDASGRVIAWCAQSSDDHGFGGKITILAGLDATDGTIRAIVVSENSETPGIGSNLCERSVKRSIWSIFRKSSDTAISLPPNRYLDGYNGQKLPTEGQFTLAEKSAPGKIVPVSGATITSRAILNTVNKICEAWQQEKPTTITIAN